MFLSSSNNSLLSFEVYIYKEFIICDKKNNNTKNITSNFDSLLDEIIYFLKKIKTKKGIKNKKTKCRFLPNIKNISLQNSITWDAFAAEYNV
ncbi:hypothetical protein [Caloramator sp. ALD01]|uniref:hypothetical protein n=1 Tax=Caloramator sp. ALD01 TaxID=1031288 RepID=UPI00068521A6|nr:hypothetical protein [Caloramator sp. ALD01]